MEKEKKIGRITARISETLKSALQELADKDRGRPLASYIVNVLEDHVVENLDLLSDDLQQKLSNDPTIAAALKSKNT